MASEVHVERSEEDHLIEDFDELEDGDSSPSCADEEKGLVVEIADGKEKDRGYMIREEPKVFEEPMPLIPAVESVAAVVKPVEQPVVRTILPTRRRREVFKTLEQAISNKRTPTALQALASLKLYPILEFVPTNPVEQEIVDTVIRLLIAACRKQLWDVAFKMQALVSPDRLLAIDADERSQAFVTIVTTLRHGLPVSVDELYALNEMLGLKCGIFHDYIKSLMNAQIQQ